MTEHKDKIRIVLADDHALVVEGLRGLLSREPDLEVTASFTEGGAMIEALPRLRPDVVVTDWQMPGRDGRSCLEQIRRSGLPVKIIILSAFGDGATLQAAWEGGADGFALKTDPPRQTIATIRNVAHGQIVFPRAVRQAAHDAGKRDTLVGRLTEREHDVLRLLAEGQTNAQIAERLSVQESTVKYHVQNIFQKLGVANRTEAAQVYFRERQNL